jgi:hypothetical protein
MRELSYVKKILDLFCKAMGMEINMDKFGILVNGLSASLQRRIEQLFPMKVDPLDKGFKYLSFYLKPNNYKYAD